MKKTLTYISILIGILLGSISIWMVPGVLAQDASDVAVEIEVDDGCNWTGTPYLPTSSLSVADNEICVIQGLNRAALNVTIDEDDGGGGQLGGRLIIGSDVVETVFTVGGTFNANGIIEVGAAGNQPVNSTLITNGNLNISATGSNGDFDIIENTNATPLKGINIVDINNNPMLVGSATTTGNFTNNDNSTSTIAGLDVYGEFENLHASGIITFDGSVGGSYIRTGSTFDNDGTLNVNADFNVQGLVSADNSGEVNVTNGHWWVGSTDAGIVTFNNSGDVNINTTGKWFASQHSTAATNTGTITAPQFLVQHGATFNNNSGGLIDTSVSGGIFVVYGDATYGNGTFNNNSGGIVTTDLVWIVDPDFGTGPNYTDRPTLNNNDGANFTAGSIDFSWDDLGDWLDPGVFVAYGSILNNDGEFIVIDDGADAVSMYRGAKLNNTANGTFTLSGTASEIEMSKSTGGAFTSECGATADIKCQITNTNVTDADAFSVSGDITLWQYAELNNNGNMTISGANNIDIEENNVSVINGSNGNLDLEGANEEFNFNVTVDNDGDIDTTTASIVMSNTASLDNASTATLTIGGTTTDLTLNNSAEITNYGVINVPDDVTLVTGGTPVTSIVNTGSSANFNVLGSDGNSVLELQVDTTFDNEASATVDVDSVASTDTDNGMLKIFGNGVGNDAIYTNDGITRVHILNIGDTNTSTDGGVLVNQGTGGEFDVTYYYTSVKSIEIYRGSITNTSTFYDGGTDNPSFDIGGQIQAIGITGDIATVTNEGVVAFRERPYFEDYSILDLDAGRWVSSANAGTSAQDHYTFIIGGTGPFNSVLDIESGATYSGQLYCGWGADSCQAYNDGTINRVDLDGVSTTRYLSVYMNNSSVFDNYGIVDFRGNMIANNSIFNNESTGTVSADTFGSLYANNGGTFNNNADAITTVNQIIIQNAGSYYYQDERSASSATKTTTTTGLIDIESGGAFQNEDLVQAVGLSVNGNGSYFYQKAGVTASNSVTTLTAASTIDASSGTATVDIDAGTTITTNNAFSVDTGGDVDNSGILTLTGTGTNNLQVDGGNYESGTSSTLNLAGTPGMQMSLNTSTAEIAGTTPGSPSFQNKGGELCLGQWNVGVGGPASNCIDSTNTITLGGLTVDTLNNTTSDDTDVYIGSNLTVQGDIDVDSLDDAAVSVDITQNSSSYLQITQNGDLSINEGSTGQGITFTSGGHMDIQGSGLGNHGHIRAEGDATVSLNHITDDYDIGSLWLLASNSEAASVTLASGATLNLNDTHTSNLGAAVITLNDNNGDGSATFTTNGTTNLNSGSTQNLILGYTTSTDGTGELEVGSGGYIEHDEIGGSSGNVDINATGRLEVIADANADKDADFYGTLTVGGDYNDGTGNRGAYIGGQLENETTLTIESAGFMDVGANGDVTVDGSTTSVSGNMELDGTLNSGDLTVTSTGVISSGDGNPTVSGSGCGVGGNFGCGSSSNFYINAGDVNVQSGGAISSDAVSTVVSSDTGGGSHGGEGEGITGTGKTYGKVKLDETGTPTYGDSTNAPSYGQAGYTGAAADGKGGGGVRIYSNGDFTNNGTISANGAAGTTYSGAGGTVIIVHQPTLSGAYFIGDGPITANGGSGTNAGGGGRVIIKSPLLDDPDFSSYDVGEDGGSVSAAPGAGGGAAGTVVYLGDGHNDGTGSTVYGTLIVDQAGEASTVQTEIPTGAPAGNIKFARIEAKNGAEVYYAADPVNDPTSCYTLDTSTIDLNGGACNEEPDKPDTLYIGADPTGAQSGTEPGYQLTDGVDNTVLSVADITPQFSVIYRHPEAADAVKMQIQVDDASAAFGSIIWDYTKSGVTEEDLSTLSNGERSMDIEYNEDSGATSDLSPGNTYYVRTRFYDATDTPGLWSHLDYNDHYKFQISTYAAIWIDNCNNGAYTDLLITQDGTRGGADMANIDGQRFGYGTCDVHVSTSDTTWDVDFGMNASEGISQALAFNTDPGNAGFSINPINNAGNDCTVDVDGIDTTEEYGFNIETYADGAGTDNQLIHDNVEADTECPTYCSANAYFNDSTSTPADADCVFDVELSTALDTIIDVVGSVLNEGIFTIRILEHAYQSDAGTYTLDAEFTLTTTTP
ncbi:beta strand repeat-containing protein [Patescibacteria group bacterium]